MRLPRVISIFITFYAGVVKALTEGLQELQWDSQNEATLYFCSDTDGHYSYKLDESDPCPAIGPVIRTVPNTHYVLTVCNALSLGVNDDLYTTNVHTHGLHISGATLPITGGEADDITREIEPQHSIKYHYDLRSDLQQGTFVYHAHKHMTTDPHVDGGAFGFFLVDNHDEVPSGSLRDLLGESLYLVGLKTEPSSGYVCLTIFLLVQIMNTFSSFLTPASGR